MCMYTYTRTHTHTHTYTHIHTHTQRHRQIHIHLNCYNLELSLAEWIMVMICSCIQLHKLLIVICPSDYNGGWHWHVLCRNTYHPVQKFKCKIKCDCLLHRDEPILLFFSPIFLSGNSFIFNLFFSIFCLKFMCFAQW